jgi:hypothetical protein
VPQPKPIKEGCLQGGDPHAYGGREAIRALVMGTRPEEFQTAADSYDTVSELLTTTIATLGDSAARLVADGSWSGESARAMLTRMNRLQAYLQSLRGSLEAIPPGLANVGRELTSAKERFDETTAQRTRQVYAMGTGGEVPVNDPDEDARQFMVRLNGVFHQAHADLPDRLPWDAELASPAPPLPSSERTPTPVQSRGLPFEDTVPARSSTGLAATPGGDTPPSTGNGQPGGAMSETTLVSAQSPGTPGDARPSAMPGLPAATGSPMTPTQAMGTPAMGTPVTGTPVTGTPQQPAGNRSGQPTGLSPAPTSGPAPPRQGDTPADRVVGREDQFRDVSLVQDTGPSVRPGSVPIVDGSWPETRSPGSGGHAPGAPTAGGMPFMPMGGMAPIESQAGRRTFTSESGDDLFRPATDGGVPVVE